MSGYPNSLTQKSIQSLLRPLSPAVCALALFTASNTANALEPAYAQAGPVYIQPTLNFDLAWTDNLYRSNDDEVESWILRTVPTVEAWMQDEVSRYGLLYELTDRRYSGTPKGQDDDFTGHRLRADIAWTAGYWDDAAEALGDVVTDQDISLTRPLKDEHTALLLQQAIALNLAGDRIALANMREKYTDLMTQTSKSKVFEVITRPRQSGALADRETLLSVVSEVDLFKEFLDAYKNATPPSN